METVDDKRWLRDLCDMFAKTQIKDCVHTVGPRDSSVDFVVQCQKHPRRPYESCNMENDNVI